MNCNLHGRGRAKWEFHGNLARFPLHLWQLWHQWWRFYDSYDPSKIWRLKYSYNDMSFLNRAYWILISELEKAKRLLLKFGRRGKVKREATWHSMRNHTNSTWIWNHRRLIMFIKYRDQPWEEAFAHLWIVRASGWLVFLLKPISRVKDSHPSWCLERPLGYFMEI